MERLLSEFPEHTYEQWHAAAEALLKGAPFEKRLVSRTYEDITIQPIYRREDIADLDHRKHFPGGDSLVRGSRPDGFLETGWEVSQELRAYTPAALNDLDPRRSQRWTKRTQHRRRLRPVRVLHRRSRHCERG
jgi:methylmalonyl-CoA mutase